MVPSEKNRSANGRRGLVESLDHILSLNLKQAYYDNSLKLNIIGYNLIKKYI
jgi:hypothetical protein